MFYAITTLIIYYRLIFWHQYEASWLNLSKARNGQIKLSDFAKFRTEIP